MRYLVVIAWIAIVLGAILRISQLPTRTVYLDEAITQIRVAGHTAAEMEKSLYDGRLRTVLAIRRDTVVSSKSSANSLVSSLIKEDAQHPPLFYLAELKFVGIFGNSLVSWRFLSAVFGILALPAAYLLGQELFRDRRAGLLAAAILAVSPIARIYSDQAREYSLLTLLVLLATHAIVQAVRLGTLRSWSWYALLATAGLYTSPFMAYTLAGHATFVFAVGMGSRRFIGFIAALAAILLAYAPWLYELIIHRNDIAATNVWSAEYWPLARLAAKWIFNTGATFFDIEYLDFRWGVVFIPIAVIAAIAIVRGFRTADAEARWCLGTAIVVPAILLIAPDILFGEHRSSVARYGIAVYAMLTIVAGRGIVSRPFAATVLLGAGLCSTVAGSLHSSWWDNDANINDASIAAVIDAVPHAQVISAIPPPEFVTIARLLHDDVRVSLSPNLAAATFSKTGPVFVLRPTKEELADLQKRTRLTFAPVPFKRQRTAHDIGLRIANTGGTPMVDFDVYRADLKLVPTH